MENIVEIENDYVLILIEILLRYRPITSMRCSITTLHTSSVLIIIDKRVTMKMEVDPKPKKKYSTFDETYSLCAFGLAFAILYPNRTNVLKRFFLVTFIISFNGGQLFWFITYTLKCLYVLDIYNFARNMTLGLILILFFIKTYNIIYLSQKFATLVDWISKDLLRANELDESYQKIIDEHIKIAKISETIWLYIPWAMSLLFPLFAGITMTINSIQTDDYEKRMVHDMEMIYVRDIQSEAPFFHLYFAYNCCQCVVLVPNFCGLDGSFCISTTHLCMKLKLFTHKLTRAYQDATNNRELKKYVIEAIKDHQDTLAFHQQLQDVYGVWLFCVFLLTSSMISFNLYMIYYEVDMKYVAFCMFGVLHIYMPCHYASTMTEVSDQIVNEIYLVPWETKEDQEVTKMLIFVMARAQQSLVVTGWIVVFNMELFKSILQTSYSFFTLITA